MGNPYTSQSISGYNDTPPSDDGATTEANRVNWSKHKTKLGDPVKTLSEAINTEVASAFGKIALNDTNSQGGSYTVLAADQGKLIRVTGAGTITTPAASTVGVPFMFVVKNEHTAAITLDGSGSENIDGSATYSLPASQAVTLMTDGTDWFTAGNQIEVLDEDDMASDSDSKVPSQQSTKAYVDNNVAQRGHIDGLILSNNGTDAAHDIDIAAGDAANDTAAVIMSLSSVLVKQIDAAWAVGTNQGGLDGTESVPGTPDADTWYHVWLIRRSDTGVVDVLFSESATAPTMPTNYDQKRRIGAVLTDGSANIITFHQYDDRFYWKTRVNEIATTTPASSKTSLTMTVPLGVEVLCILHGHARKVGTGFVYFFSPDDDDLSPSEDANDLAVRTSITQSNSAEFTRKTNTSSQIDYRTNGGTWESLSVDTLGWIDPRGRNA